MMASSGVGRFRRLLPVGVYVLAQTYFLFTVLQAFLERGVSIWWPFRDFVMFLYVFVLALLPALVVGAVDGVARSRCEVLGRTRWIVPLRIVAFLLIAILAFSTALIAAFFLAFADSSLNASTGGLALGTYYCALTGMEAVLAVAWDTSVLAERVFERRRRVRKGRR
jgi:hypothetical protein